MNYTGDVTGCEPADDRRALTHAMVGRGVSVHTRPWTR